MERLQIDNFSFTPLISGDYNAFEEGWDCSTGNYCLSGNHPSSTFANPMYIGAYESGCSRRIQEHLKALKRGNHHNPPLQRYYSKRSTHPDFELLVFDVKVPFVNDPWDAEVVLIEHFGRAKDFKTFNVAEGGRKPPIVDEAGRAKASASMKETWAKSPERKLALAERASRLNKGRQRPDLATRNKARSQPCRLVNKHTGEEASGTNIAEFCRSKDLTLSAMCAVISGRGYNKSHKGWRVLQKS